MISDARGFDGEALADYLSRWPVDCMKIVPTHFAALLNLAAPEEIMPRHALVLGGEACDWEFVDRLQKAGLVERQRDRNDRRSVQVALTKKGLALIDELIARHVENETAILAGLPKKDQRALSDLLGKLIATMPPPYSDRLK